MNCDRCGTKLFDNETTGRCVSCSGNRDPGRSSPVSESADPLAGLAERLDRLCLTSTEDGRRFVLATESAKNIVEIVRVWIGSRGFAQTAKQQGCGDPNCKDPDCEYGRYDDGLQAEVRQLRTDNARLRDEAARKEPMGWLYLNRHCARSYSPTRLPHCVALGWQEIQLYAESAVSHSSTDRAPQ